VEERVVSDVEKEVQRSKAAGGSFESGEEGGAGAEGGVLQVIEEEAGEMCPMEGTSTAAGPGEETPIQAPRESFTKGSRGLVHEARNIDGQKAGRIDVTEEA